MENFLEHRATVCPISFTKFFARLFLILFLIDIISFGFVDMPRILLLQRLPGYPGAHIMGVWGVFYPQKFTISYKKVGPEKPMKSKKSVPTSIGFEYANNAKLFCDRLCLYLYIGIRKVGPTIEYPPPPKFYEDVRPCGYP